MSICIDIFPEKVIRTLLKENILKSPLISPLSPISDKKSWTSSTRSISGKSIVSPFQEGKVSTTSPLCEIEQVLHFFKKIKNVGVSILQSVYFGIFDSHLNNSCLIWAKNSNSVYGLRILQKKNLSRNGFLTSQLSF